MKLPERCVFCNTHKPYVMVYDEPKITMGRFVKGELILLKKGDGICYDCEVVRRPIK